MPFNWIDWIIIVVVFYFAARGWTEGLWHLGVSLISFFLSLFLALRLEPSVAPFLTQKIGLPESWAAVTSYVGIAFLTEAIIASLLNDGLARMPKKMIEGEISHVLGAMFSVVNGLLLTTFFLVLLMALPLRGTIQQDIQRGTIAPRLLSLTTRYGGPIRTAIEHSADELAQFLTIKPESGSRIPLDAIVEEKDLIIDEKAEQEMLILVNTERTSRGGSPLALDEKMRAVARAYSKKMFLGRYFAHVDDDGYDVADRMKSGGVQFRVAGENLAYAPSLTVAHKGLMNSEGHKRNILDPQFRRVGIGVIDGGSWGKMFTQVFAE